MATILLRPLGYRVPDIIINPDNVFSSNYLDKCCRHSRHMWVLVWKKNKNIYQFGKKMFTIFLDLDVSREI